jgi:tetratricopeptide (TPR) repeat protein
MNSTMRRNRACAWIGSWLVLAIMTSPLQAQDMDSLFREFNRQFDAGSYAEAERTARRMVAASPTQSWLAASLNVQGRTLNALRKYDDAVKALERASGIALAADHINRGWIPNNLGIAYRHEKRYDDSLRLLERAKREFERLKGSQSREVGAVLENLGWLAHDQDQYDKAEKHHREALAVRTPAG